jgi:thymidine phosphorylase
MLPQEIIRKKRDGATLSSQDIEAFIAGLSDGRVTEAQAAAFAMAVFFRGMTMDERVALTLAMTRSGTMLTWRDMPGPVLDKHSTGGIGDTVSLMLAPAVAACGGYVPMISGRGLGHTGGTLDKLDSIPSYCSQPDLALFREVVTTTGCAIIGQTADLAPVDGRLYAIRDVTATVESIPLITASILSKKLAAGLHGLVMDVKTGSGAFMPSLEGAKELAESIAHVATGAGLPTTALITDMDEPLASAAGNALEVKLAVEYLTGKKRDARLHAVTLALGAEMLLLGALADNYDHAIEKMEIAITSGRAAERFAHMVAALKGPRDLLDRPEMILPRAAVVRPVPAHHDGFVSAIATRAIGLAVVELGGGRTRASDAIDPSVGFAELKPVGMKISRGEPLGFVHAATDDQADRASASLIAAYSITPDAPLPRALIHDRIEGQHSR